jgi:hypothetical protein
MAEDGEFGIGALALARAAGQEIAADVRGFQTAGVDGGGDGFEEVAVLARPGEEGVQKVVEAVFFSSRCSAFWSVV